MVRIPAALGAYRRMELRSADPMANPYLAFALMIYAGLEGITGKMPLCAPVDINFYTAGADVLAGYKSLPESFEEACRAAQESSFIKTHIPSEILAIHCGK